MAAPWEGKAMSVCSWKKKDILDALDGVTWYNGLAEEVIRWKDLPILPNGDILAPDIVGERSDTGHQLQVIWMIAVFLFGDYGTSPRFGWISDVEGFQRFCQDITKTWREAEEDV